MKRINVEAGGARLEFTRDELDVLRNGLNEARLAVKGEADFQTRLGVTRDEARALLRELAGVIEEIFEKQSDSATPKAAAGAERL